MKRTISILFLYIIIVSNAIAQQGYWFQNRFIALEPDNSSRYYAQLRNENIPKEYTTPQSQTSDPMLLRQ